MKRKKTNEKKQILRKSSTPNTNSKELSADTEKQYTADELIQLEETARVFAEIIYDNYYRSNEQQ